MSIESSQPVTQSVAVETQRTICDWALNTFGPSGSNLRVAARANEEMAELLRAVTAKAPWHDILEEAADVLIVLARVGERLCVELEFQPVTLKPLSPRATIKQAVCGVNRNIAYLLDTLAWDNPAQERLLDAWYSLLRLIKHMGGDAQAVVDAKMAKNRKRVWNHDGTGHGYHLRDKQTLDT